MRALLAAVIVALSLTSLPARAEITSFAFVQDDGTLKVRGRTIRLFGIYIPPTERTCRTFMRPVRCAQRAVLALDFRVQGFVRCTAKSRNRDRSINAVCHVDGEGSILSPRVDLSAWMLRHGWAVALPNAPFQYFAFERIARVNRRGVWGFHADLIR